MKRTTLKTKWLAVALAGGLSACGGGEEPLVGPGPNREVQSPVRLDNFENCHSLENYIEDTAVQEMSAYLDSYTGSGNGGPWFGGGWDDLERGEAAPQAAGAAGPADHTTTNTQVRGVDEADFVKNDGTRIFVLSGGVLYINQSWPADQLKNVAKLQIEGWPSEMYLSENDRIVVFSSVYSEEVVPGSRLGQSSGGDRTSFGASCPEDGMCYGYYYANTLKLTTIDVSNLSQPRVVGETYMPGSYVNSRRIGNAVRVVSSDWFRYPTDLKYWVEDQSVYNDPVALKAAYQKLKVENAAKIRARSLDQWLPAGKRKLADGSLVDIGYACSDFYRSNAPENLGLVTVATFDIAQPDAAPKRTSILAHASQVYASTTALYLASPHWWFSAGADQKSHTYLHKFDISQPARAEYLASGGVTGTITDQFQLDEHADHLRVATTTDWWEKKGDRFEWKRYNKVNVLRQNGPNLDLVGETGELAPGESIFAARFIGNRGFIVTFRQVDPLFTFDLSDPRRPTVVGELKIPGFSTYLHPIDDNHLIGMGEDRDEDGSWRSRAMKISIYDVSDMAKPVEKYKHLFGSYSSYSTASHDHKAFNYFASKKLLAVPFFDWSSNYSGSEYWSRFTSDLRVFSIDPATGITPRGSLSVADVYQSQQWENWSYYWQPMVRRSVMADDFVYAIGDAGVRVANISDLAAPLATISFTPPTSTKP